MQKRQIDHPIRVVGITGGIGAGKSRILELLQTEFGAQVILADEVAKQLEEPGGAGLLALCSAFGDDILSPDGTLDRSGFASRIFHNPSALRQTNAMIHPLVWEEIGRQIQKSSASLIAVESALFDEETRGICDELWFVDTDKEIRINRLMTSRGYSRKKCEEIICSQRNRDEYLVLADFAIRNDGTVNEVRGQIAARLGIPDK